MSRLTSGSMVSRTSPRASTAPQKLSMEASCGAGVPAGAAAAVMTRAKCATRASRAGVPVGGAPERAGALFWFVLVATATTAATPPVAPGELYPPPPPGAAFLAAPFDGTVGEGGGLGFDAGRRFRLFDEISRALLSLGNQSRALLTCFTQVVGGLLGSLLELQPTALSGREAISDGLLPGLDGQQQRRPDELRGEPDEDREGDGLCDQGEVDVHLRS